MSDKAMNDPACVNCYFSRMVRMAGQITEQRVCAIEPYKGHFLPGPQGPMLTSIQPPVPDTGWCGEYSPIEGDDGTVLAN